jgi:hypothetical protein
MPIRDLTDHAARAKATVVHNRIADRAPGCPSAGRPQDLIELPKAQELEHRALLDLRIATNPHLQFP